MSTRPGDPAYPVTDYTGDYPITEPGLTKREYFAALSMQGLITRGYEGGQSIPQDIMASWAVGAADALIAALNEEPGR